MSQHRPVLFRGRHFEDVIILRCVRWYLRYSLSYRDLEERMEERGLPVDHVTIWRWVQRSAPLLNQRLRRELRHPNRSWRVDEWYVYVKVAGSWTYLYRAVDSVGDTIDFMRSPDWIQRFFQRKPPVPDGWTGDMSVQLPRGHTVEELVEYILVANQEGRQHETLIADLANKFGLSNEDAELSADRVGGGIVRAATGNRANCPNRAKDPIAWASFQRAITRR